MSDIIERLRSYENPQETLRWTNAAFVELARAVTDGAAEIERLQAENKRLRAEIELISK